MAEQESVAPASGSDRAEVRRAAEQILAERGIDAAALRPEDIRMDVGTGQGDFYRARVSRSVLQP